MARPEGDDQLTTRLQWSGAPAGAHPGPRRPGSHLGGRRAVAVVLRDLGGGEPE